MEGLLAARYRLRRIYADYDVYLRPLFKAVTALFCLLVLWLYTGYLPRTDSLLFVVGGAVLCAFLPWGAISFVSAVYVLLNMAEVSLMLTALTGLLLLIMFVLYFGFKPGNGLIIALVPVAFILKVPFLVPLLLGLSAGAFSCIPAALGVLFWFCTQYLHVHAADMAQTTDATELVNEFTSISRAIFGSRYLMLVVLGFALSIVLVAGIRRLSMDHAWTIALAAGTIVLAVVVVLGGSIVGGGSFVVDIVGLVVSLLLALLYEHIFFCVDYAGVERVQFEDDDYYYYVKAVPKIRPYEEEERFE